MVIVTSERYIDMFNNFFVPQLRDEDFDELNVWFRQNVDTAHTAQWEGFFQKKL